jgi:hypothetical protein
MTTEAEIQHDKVAQDKAAEEKRLADQKAEADKKPFFAPKVEPVKNVASDSKEAGLQHIRQAINLIKSHSAASIGGGMLHDALELLESGYGIIAGPKA